MGNILKCFLKCFGGEDDGGGDHYPYYPLTSRPHHQPRYCDQPAVPVPPASRPQQPPLGPHGVTPITVRVAAMAHGLLSFQSEAQSMVPEGLRQHVTSSRKAHVKCPHCQPAVPAPASRPHQQLPPPRIHGVAALEVDLLIFKVTSTVPEGLREHVTSSRKAQVEWYRKMLEAYKDKKTPPRTSAEAAMLVATALSRIQRANLEGVLAFYGFPIPTIPAAASGSNPSSIPKGVQLVLNTLPVNAKYIVDGDGFTAYVDTVDPRESANVPLEVRQDFTARSQARDRRNYKRAKALHDRLQKAEYKIVATSGGEVLAKKYRIRMRGIDAPEMQMQYGKESQKALVKLIAGKSVTLYVYGQDQYERHVCDIYCGGVFIQEQMLKKGHAWHFKNYDKRPEFAKWEKKARAARGGLWAYDNPEEPWDWRKKNKRTAQGMRTSPFRCIDGS